MPDPDKTSGWHMHQKTPYKFNAGNGQFLPLSFFPVILNGKSNIFIIHLDDAVIADSDPMGILSKVINHRLCTVKSFLTVLFNGESQEYFMRLIFKDILNRDLWWIF